VSDDSLMIGTASAAAGVDGEDEAPPDVLAVELPDVLALGSDLTADGVAIGGLGEINGCLWLRVD